MIASNIPKVDKSILENIFFEFLIGSKWPVMIANDVPMMAGQLWKKDFLKIVGPYIMIWYDKIWYMYMIYVYDIGTWYVYIWYVYIWYVYIWYVYMIYVYMIYVYIYELCIYDILIYYI